MPRVSKTQLLAAVLIDKLDKTSLDRLYDCLRTAVYGLPGESAIQAADLVHELAELCNKSDPSSAA